MQEPLVPFNEEQRLRDLYSYDILDTGIESDFEDLVNLVSEICQVPIASITFIDRDRQWFKAERNMNGREGSRKDSFCGHVIHEKEIMLVNDATKDARFFDNPHVTSGLKIGFYAGAPIVSSSGFVLGSVCAIDNNPRELTAKQVAALQSISRQVSRLLDLRLKNKQIATTAEKLIRTEKRLAQWNIHQREEENFRTAFILHEETAQVIAAVKLYIDMARGAKDMSDHFLDLAAAEVDSLLRSTTDLSRSLAPTTFKDSNYVGHIEEIVISYSRENKVKAVFKSQPGLTYLKDDLGIAVFRISQEMLCLSRAAGSENISLVLSGTKKAFTLAFEYDGDLSLQTVANSGLKNNIANRVAMLRGDFELVNLGSNKMSAKLTIPVDEVLKKSIY